MSLLIDHFYRFGDFTLDSDQRILLRKGKPQPLAPKVFDTLLILVERNGRIVEKDELMNQLWPDTFVEEANLTFNVQQLRKALGDKARKPRYIETVTRRGYRFIATVEEILSDRGVKEIAGRLEPSDSQSQPLPLKTQNNGHHLSDQHQPSTTVPVSDQASTTTSNRRFLIPAALIVLAGAGLAIWGFSNASKDSLVDKQRDLKTLIMSALKFERLTKSGESRLVAISPDGKYIAYTRTLKGKGSIWLRQLSTNINLEIIPPTDPIFGLEFANSGEYLWFAKRGEPIAGALLYKTALYRVSLIGGVPSEIVRTLEGKFSISPDDRQVAFIRQSINRDGQREFSLMIANSDGTGERSPFVGTHPDDLDVPIWSPDGQSIICANGTPHGGGQHVTLTQVRIADGSKKELSPERFFCIKKMAWLPGKTALIICARKNVSDNNQLWCVSYPGMEITQITEDMSPYLDLSIASGADKAVTTQANRISDIWVGASQDPKTMSKITQAISTFCWAPNGRLVYSSNAAGNGDIWTMQPDGSEQRQLTVNAAMNASPAVTPDNRYIVFLSNRMGSFQIWRMNFDGSNQIQLTDGPGGKESPVMSLEGKWVLYNTTDDWRLWRISIDGGKPAAVTDYFAARPSVSPDGKMIACQGRNETEASVLILPFEGGPPLKKLPFFGFTTRLQWTADGKALVMTIERDGRVEMIKQPLSGGAPQSILDFGEDEVFDFGYSCDGRLLAVTRGGWQHDIVLISDLNLMEQLVARSDRLPTPAQTH